MKIFVHAVLATSLTFAMMGCQTNTQTGALAGGVGGMAIGGAVGGWQGAAIGGAAGALLGAGIGSMVDANGRRHELKLSTLCEWRQRGMSELDITAKLGNAKLHPLNKEQIDYLKECGFSNDFIRWWQGHVDVAG